MANNEIKELKGTILSSGIVPGTTADKFPTHYAKYGQGGFRTVNSLEELDEIPEERLEIGMLVYVVENDNTYQYKLVEDRDEDGNIIPEVDEEGNILTDSDGNIISQKSFKWIIANLSKGGGSGAGIPIYDKDMLNELGISDNDKYISISTENELLEEPTEDTITIKNDGSYLNILFSAIRQLQLEVARLRNSFRYGICSYTGTQTSMSETMSESPELPEEEPLWAVEPDGLSAILGAEVSYNIPNLTTNSNYTQGEDLISIINGSWVDKNQLVNFTTDPKIFLYTTFLFNDQNSSEKTSDINIILSRVINTTEEFEELDLDEDGNIIFDESELTTISIKEINKNTAPIYDLQIIISRKIKINEEFLGDNFIWISISNPINKTTLVEGYYDVDKGRLSKTKVSVDKEYTINKINFKDTSIKYVDFYSKYQDFSKNIISSKPEEDNYKYKVAHLTIRSVSNEDELQSIKDQLLENELIFTENNNTLWIKNNYDLIKIGAQGNNNNNNNNIIMNEEQLITLLEQAGIISRNETNKFELTNISDITFIHQDSNKVFKISPNSLGELESIELPERSLIDRLSSNGGANYDGQLVMSNSEYTNGNIRGFASFLNCYEQGKNFNSTSDVGLESDRIKISAIYSPLNTDTVFGCSHAYIELENTSNLDFDLTGCYIHYCYKEEGNTDNTIKSLKLKGKIPAGSTYLIRGKKYSDPELNPNTYISVNDFDLEWWIDTDHGKELIDLTRNIKVIDGKLNYESTIGYSYALTYGKLDELENPETLCVDNSGKNPELPKKNYPIFWKKNYIDSIIISANQSNIISWAPSSARIPTIQSNSIIKNTFALDPAKQAFNGLNKADSSRYRGEKVGTDIQLLSLDSEYISFPHSNETYKVNKFTPKSSKQNKTVLTDKTWPDFNKPNSVYVTFGIDMYTTRCFNWVSIGKDDEYVFIKKVGEEDWKSFESYKQIEKEETQSSNVPFRKEFSVSVNNTIYARLSNIFPLNNVPNYGGISYTSHKCIVQLINETDDLSEKVEYSYIVGKKLKNGNPDLEHCSDEMKFTLYPRSYEPRIYQITDQQGFHWIEYQVWAAAANKLNEKIIEDCNNENIIPILINTGDVTQNGTRVNEWLDYYNAGKVLFNHLEHMSVVGNNDLVDTDITKLGTGNDIGKSNGYFFHLFNCYEISETIKIKTIIDETEVESLPNISPIINNKYVPSLYYIDWDYKIDKDNEKKYRFLMCNSEITVANCREWFELLDTNKNVYNIYTGWKIRNTTSSGEDVYDNRFNNIYNITWNIMKNASDDDRSIIAACHELPFTVLTSSSLSTNLTNVSRSVDTDLGLVGSHLNQIADNDLCTKGLYWFSRLCEFFNVKLVLGGHKHTYAATFPVREYYGYTTTKEGSTVTVTSLSDGPMKMEDTLVNDSVNFNINGINSSKFPITYKYGEFKNENDGVIDNTVVYPTTKPEESEIYKSNAVVYFMCQATGYKQTSNKELPANNQKFAELIPDSGVDGKTADNNQKYPMAAIIKLDQGESDSNSIINVLNTNTYHQISLIRFTNIMDKTFKFTQVNYGKEDIKIESIKKSSNTRFGTWSTEE